MTAKKAKALLASVRPRDEIGRLRRQLAAELLAELVTLDKKVAAIETELRTMVRSTPTGLPKIYGVGPVITALTLGEVGDVARFADRNHFASYNGTAPDDKGNAGNPAHCVNIKGNRKPNPGSPTSSTANSSPTRNSQWAREGKRGRLSQPA